MALFARDRSADEPSRAQLRGWHLLLLPSTIAPMQVDELVRARVPDARLLATGRARLGRQSSLSGPYDVRDGRARQIDVPARWAQVYAVEVAPERDPTAFQDIADPVLRAWWMRAFPTGKPYRDEGEAVDLAFALARRLGGSVRCAGSTLVVTPDPDRLVDLTVWSGYWLGPDELVAVVGPVLPGAHVDFGGRPWRGPAEAYRRPWSLDRLDPVAVDLAHALDDEGRAAIVRVADAVDGDALSGPDSVDSFSLSAEGDLVVEVVQEDVTPPWVRSRVAHQQPERGDPVVRYAVRWMPDDLAVLESEDAGPELRAARAAARARVRTAALAVAEATAGVISDGDGFEVDRYRL